MNASLQGKKILFATLPADGHFNPLTGLAKYLQAAGGDVRWYTSPRYRGKLEQLGIRHYPFRQALDTNGHNLDEHFPARTTMQDPVERLNFDMINGLVRVLCLHHSTLTSSSFASLFDIQYSSESQPSLPPPLRLLRSILWRIVPLQKRG